MFYSHSMVLSRHEQTENITRPSWKLSLINQQQDNQSLKNLPYIPVTLRNGTVKQIARRKQPQYHVKSFKSKISQFGTPWTRSAMVDILLYCCFVYLQYNKPAEILEMEKKVQEEISNLKSSEDGDVDCKQSWGI